MKIHVDQLGYRPDDVKVAILAGDEPVNGPVYLVKESDSTRVELSVSAFGKDSYSGETLYSADFSKVSEEGLYFIEYYDCSRSDSFLISPTVYRKVFEDLVHMFYFMRCGCELPEKYAGPYHHRCCHAGKTLRYDDQAMLPPMTGGWHDAGDYGRYTTPGAVTLGHLLYTYELFSVKCPTLLIPESGNGVPDILNECRYELEWLLKMQASDGSVYHKLTTERFAGFVMPEEDKDQMILYPISSMATADFAAVTALASRIFRRYDSAFAARLRAAALSAREFLYAHPDLIDFRNPPGNYTGGYWDRDDRDERMWMYAELYRLNGDVRDLAELTKLAATDIDKTTLGWGQVGGFAGLSVLFAPSDTFPDELFIAFSDAFRKRADSLMALTSENGYRLAMPLDGFVWGSNMVVMDCSAALLVASFLTGNPAYASAAEENVHYLLGRNPLNRSYITGHGSHPFRNPHNRPTASDGVDEPFPGLVSGGPSARVYDPPAKAAIPEGTPPLLCHLDEVESFSTNEIAIYWNSITALVFAYFA
ncbi:MAG: glycoside hydrolase family 9 protein [Lachnospiraceae bacterium]|nr:glycoside hydrolase family 9 protein [Lachnospiraceae bacterium]